MTTPEQLIPRIPLRELPIPFDDDLVIDFRNRDKDKLPTDPDAYPDYPADTTGTLTIYADLETSGATRISKTATPSGSHCVIKLDSTELVGVKPGTKWRFRLTFPDVDLPGGYNKRVVNGLTVIDDGDDW